MTQDASDIVKESKRGEYSTEGAASQDAAPQEKKIRTNKYAYITFL